MARAPYPARIAAGLLVTAIEETRKLPTLIVTFPMTAVSQTLQMGMRAQQNIAELAIKGDHVLESLFDKPSEQPEWAQFDDDPVLDSGEPEVARATPLTTTSAPSAAAPVREPADGPTAPAAPAEDKAPTKKTASTKQAASKKTSTKRAAAEKSAPKKAVAKKTVAAESDETDSPNEGPASDAGRFALYSSTPDDLLGASAAKKAPTTPEKKVADGVKAPEIAVYIDYDALTLAQLRAKLRSVSADELAELVAHEKAGRNRVHFISMLDNRIAAQQKRQSST